jgi:hypothetical protein
MKVSKVSEGEHCNFCNRGELNDKLLGLSYPYNYVYQFAKSSGGGLLANICEDCLKELNEKVLDLKKNKS